MIRFLKNKSTVIVAVLLAGTVFFPAVAQAAVSPEKAAELRTELITDGKKYIGAPYEYGAIDPDKFDCSGFIYSVSRESTGYQLPRTVGALYSFVRIIPDADREDGDIVFFHTTGTGNVSHAGIYIGNNQFIHAASDGPNTGVIVSSLREAYWKTAYSCTGQFLPSAKAELLPTATTKPLIAKKTASYSTGRSSGFSAKNLVFDASVGLDWSFFTPRRFMLNFRGVPLQFNIRYSSWALQPGIGMIFRFNTAAGVFQMPIVFSLTMNDYVRVYAGPVVSFGTPNLPDSDTEIKASVFPGIMGVSWQTPSFKKGTVRVTMFQDISYTIFNDTDGSALSLSNSIATGIVFSTGIRVTLPMSMLFR